MDSCIRGYHVYKEVWMFNGKEIIFTNYLINRKKQKWPSRVDHRVNQYHLILTPRVLSLRRKLRLISSVLCALMRSSTQSIRKKVSSLFYVTIHVTSGSINNALTYLRMLWKLLDPLHTLSTVPIALLLDENRR